MDVADLKSIPLFAGLPHRVLDQLARRMDIVDVPAGRTLIGEGVLAYEFMIIKQGTAEATHAGGA